MKRWLLCPGYVMSKRDGQRHFVKAQQLARLYGVPRDECVVKGEGHDEHGLTLLFPRYDGNYTLPETVMNYSKLAQVRAEAWCRRAFGDEVVGSLHERAARILEEAAELCQAEGVSLPFAQNIVEKVFSRPVGEPAQELAGVMVTTAIYAEVKHLSRSDLEMMEIVRVENMLAANPEHFRRRHAEKQNLGMSMGSPDLLQTMCDCDCHRPGVTKSHPDFPCCPHMGEKRTSTGHKLIGPDLIEAIREMNEIVAGRIPSQVSDVYTNDPKGEPDHDASDIIAEQEALGLRMLGPRIEGFAPSPGTGLEPHKAALREAEGAHAEQVMYCCEKGKAQGVQICLDCEPFADNGNFLLGPPDEDCPCDCHDAQTADAAVHTTPCCQYSGMVWKGVEKPEQPQGSAHGSETAPEPDADTSGQPIVDPGASQAVTFSQRVAAKCQWASTYGVIQLGREDFENVYAGFEAHAIRVRYDMTWEGDKFKDKVTQEAWRCWLISAVMAKMS